MILKFIFYKIKYVEDFPLSPSKQIITPLILKGTDFGKSQYLILLGH